MKKQVIATGLSGLVGSRIFELLNHKFKFINFSLDSGVDITNSNLLKQKFNQYSLAKLVLHLAAFTDVDASWRQNGDKNGSCYKVNVLGSKNIAQLCAKTGKHLIHISTDFVFDGKNPPKEGYTEKDPPNPIEWYGKTKLLAEEEIKKSGCNYTILRIAFPFKAKPAPLSLEPVVKFDLVRKIKQKLEAKKEVKMFTDQTITPTFIDDICMIVNQCLIQQPQEIFHCVGSSSLSPYSLALKIASIFSLDKSLIKRSSLANYLKKEDGNRPRQKNLMISNKKLESQFGIKMLTIEKALAKLKKQLDF